MLRVGVVGVGHLGRFHTRVYSELRHMRTRGRPRYRRRERRPRWRASTGRPRWRTWVSSSSSVDAVSIATPTVAHHEVARRCLESGVHVLIEKPIATTVEEARDLVEPARERGLVMQVGHIERFNPAVRAAHGSAGCAQVHRGAPARRLRSQRDGRRGGAGSHDPRHRPDPRRPSGSDVTSIEAVGIRVLSSNIDIANARLSFADGCVANITASRVSREKVRKIRFFQPDAYVTVDTLKPRAQVFRRKDVSEEKLRQISRLAR